MSNTSLLGSYGAQDNSSIIFRNKLYNGCFRVWQRATSQTSSGYGSDDRWRNSNVGSTKTHSRQNFPPGSTDGLMIGNPEYYSRTVVSSVAGASNFVLKYQKIESVRTLAGQTATLSFWARADAPKNMAVEFRQNFGTGGSPSAEVNGIGVTTIALTTSWKYYTVTVNIPSIAGKTLGTAGDDNLEVNFWFDGGSNTNARTNNLGQQSGTFDIAQVQLEAGPVATPFEHRPYGLELSLCQRYYEIIGSTTTAQVLFVDGNAPVAGHNTVINYSFKQTKRTASNIIQIVGNSWSNVNCNNSGAPTSLFVGLDTVAIGFQSTSTGRYYSLNNAGTYLVANAEL